MESIPDIEAMAARMAAYEGAQITHLVMSHLVWDLVRVPLAVMAAYAPLPYRRWPSKRSGRRLRGRIAEALKGA